MPSRLPLFVKKRGTRRTGPRWAGLLAEAALFVGLIALGAYGLYWLIVRVLLDQSVSHGWWPWLAILVPFALVGYGGTGLVLLIWQSLASSERRAAAVRRAIDWELPGGPARGPEQDFPSVPPIEAVIDSPGVRLPFRLPIDAASGWISVTMAAVCLGWNTLVAMFVVQVVRQHLAGRPNWLLTWLMAPFVLAGAWTLVALARQVMLDIIIGTTRLEVAQHPFYPGGTFRGFVSQTGRLHVRWFQVHIVCEEQAVYQQGTDTRRATSEVYRATVFNQRKFDIRPQQAFEEEFEIAVPVSAMHSFVSPHNAVIWTLVVRGRVARWGEFERRFPIYVYPSKVSKPLDAPPVSLAAGRQSP